MTARRLIDPFGTYRPHPPGKPGRLYLDPIDGATIWVPDHPPVVAEYGSLKPEDMAQRTVLAKAPHRRGYGDVELVRSTDGYECAGSAG